MRFSDKRIAVVGLGVSGSAAARFLLENGAQVLVVDDNDSERAREEEKNLIKLGAVVHISHYDRRQALETDFIVASPGLPLNHPLLQEAARRNVPVKGEIELAAECVKNDIIAVTGTNGKSSVTSMIAHMLKGCGYPAISCGNIGNAFIGEVSTLKKDMVIVLEISSFQLARMHTFSPRVAVLLNITPDHIDWHGSFEAYADAKWSIFRHQKSTDFAVINDGLADSIKPNSIPSKIRYFKGSGNANPNMNACLEVACALGIESELAISKLKDFKPLEHRINQVLGCL